MTVPGSFRTSMPTSASRIAADTVVKSTLHSFESPTMQLVAAHTTIFTPRVRRVVTREFSHRTNYLVVMNHIPGVSLEECWGSLSWFRKLWIAVQLRSYVRQLWRIRRDNPGPVGDGPQECVGRYFTELNAGPFSTYSELASWFSRKLSVSKRIRKTSPDAPEMDTSWPLVLVHQDLGPHNLILGDDGRLWVIDWGWSGFYPGWFELAGMEAYNWSTPKSWKWLMLAATGPWYRQSKFLDSISYVVQVAYMAQ